MIRGLLAFALVTLASCLGPFSLAGAADAQPPASPWHIGVVYLGVSSEHKDAPAFGRGLRDAGQSNRESEGSPPLTCAPTGAPNGGGVGHRRPIKVIVRAL